MVSTILVIVFHYRNPRGILLHLDTFGAEIQCRTQLQVVSPPFPAILIDNDLLTALMKDECKQLERKVRLAVKGNETETSSENTNHDELYEIIRYEEPLDKNYLLFHDSETRIIPKLKFEANGSLLVPSDIVRFAKFWNMSKLVDCLRIDMNRTSAEPYLPVTKTIETMSSFMDYLHSFGVYPILNGGSLLGWYRECGLIPHTRDVDFSADAGEYESALLDGLRSNKKFHLKRVLGRPNDSYEFTVTPLGSSVPSIDLFWRYNEGNNSWVGGTAHDGTKYKYVYPRVRETCAADLLGHIFWIPCDPEKTIVTEYGPKWYVDYPSSKFSWSSSHFNVRRNGKWSKEEMKEVYRTF